MSLIRKHGAVLQAWACLALVYKCHIFLRFKVFKNILNVFTTTVGNTFLVYLESLTIPELMPTHISRCKFVLPDRPLAGFRGWAPE